MATRGVEPITLPWKRPEKGVSAAELGASFRVEQREDGWHCTVRVGRRAEVLATGLRRLRDAQCRAEAHAATLPEVAAALAKRKAEAEKPAAKEQHAAPVRAASQRATSDVRGDRPGPPARPRTAAPTFEPISDGCICGKIEGGTWIADPAGKVSVPLGTAPEVAQAICRVASQHYAAQRAKTVATPERPRAAAKAAARTAAKRKPAVEVKKTQPTDEAATATPRRAGKGKRGKGKNRAARKRLAAKLAGTTATRAAANAASETADRIVAKAATKPKATRVAKVAAKKTVKTAATAKTAAKATTAKTAKTVKTAAKTTTAKTAKTAKTTAAASIASKSTARTAKTTAAKAATVVQVTAKAVARAEDTAKTGKRSGRPREAGKQAPLAAQTEEVEKPMGKKSGKASKGECGCMAWIEAEGKARGEAKHGAFVIEPEGKKHALYFYDPDGQSRHVQSGDAAKLRKVAEEMATRGQPTTRAASAGDDAALLKMFMAGAMEEEP